MPVLKRQDFSPKDTLFSKVTGNTWIIREVRKGGLGVVYVVEDAERTVTYALKTFQARYLWQDADRNRFEREAKVSRAIHDLHRC